MRRADHRPREAGFTLVEVLIAMAITAFVSVLSYQTLSTALVVLSQRAPSQSVSTRLTVPSPCCREIFVN